MASNQVKLSVTDSFIAQLTRSSGELLDWHNVGGLARQRTKDSWWGLWANYSWRELFVRGGIVVTTGLCFYMAYNSCDSEVDEACSSLLRGVGAGLGGFFVSHAVAVYPTIKRRNAIKNKTNEFKNEILGLSKKIISQWPVDKKQAVQESLQTVAKLVEEILSMDLPINKRADNVRNLLFRKKCLELVRDKLYEQFFEEEIKSFESVDLATIKEFWINPEVLNNLVPEQKQKLIASIG